MTATLQGMVLAYIAGTIALVVLLELAFAAAWKWAKGRGRG